jgi:exodeoxyribonuclease V alpha subunit
MYSLIEKHGGESKINEHIRNKSLRTIPGIGKKREKDIIEFMKKYSESIIDKIESKYNEIDITEDERRILQKNTGTLETIYNILNDIKGIGDYYKERAIENTIEYIIKEVDVTDFFNMRYEPTKILKKFIPTISLKKMDEVALENKWWDKTSQNRYDCFALDFIQKLCKNIGHIYFSIADVRNYFNQYDNHENVILDNIIISLERLEQDEHIFMDKKEKVYYYKEYYDMETDILEIIGKFNLIKYDNHLTKEEIISSLNDDPCNKVISDEQVDSVNGINKNKVSNLSGKGGTGKTSKVVKSQCDRICRGENKGLKVLFTAPTHAAKKNGRNVIGHQEEIDYSVIQSLTYEYFVSEGGVEGYSNKLINLLKENCIEYIFIDESSMLDTPTYHKLMIILDEYYEETNDNIRIVFLGDDNQLPPIGIGDPYVSLLGKIETYNLTKNHRSNSEIKEFSEIILNNGMKGDKWTMDDIKGKYESIECNFTDIEKDWIKELKVTLKKLKKEGYSPYDGDDEGKNFQIITFKNDCCREVCPIIRKIFNDNKSKEVFEVGDTVVMQKNVKPYFYNNDNGIITGKTNTHYIIEMIEMEEMAQNIKEKCIKFEGHKLERLSEREIKIPINTFDRTLNTFIKPNYGRTVHSVQGLQFPRVIFILPKSYGPLVNIKLTYTAYSRAKEKLYLIGQQHAFDNYHSKSIGAIKNSTLYFNDKQIKDISTQLNSKGYTRISKANKIENGNKQKKTEQYDIWNKFNDNKCKKCSRPLKVTNFRVGLIDEEKGYGDSENKIPVCLKCFIK